MADYKDAIQKLIGLHVSGRQTDRAAGGTDGMRWMALVFGGTRITCCICTAELLQCRRGCVGEVLQPACTSSCLNTQLVQLVHTIVTCCRPCCLQLVFVFIKVAWRFAVFKAGGALRQLAPWHVQAIDRQQKVAQQQLQLIAPLTSTTAMAAGS